MHAAVVALSRSSAVARVGESAPSPRPRLRGTEPDRPVAMAPEVRPERHRDAELPLASGACSRSVGTARQRDPGRAPATGTARASRHVRRAGPRPRPARDRCHRRQPSSSTHAGTRSGGTVDDLGGSRPSIRYDERGSGSRTGRDDHSLEAGSPTERSSTRRLDRFGWAHVAGGPVGHRLRRPAPGAGDPAAFRPRLGRASTDGQGAGDAGDVRPADQGRRAGRTRRSGGSSPR